MTGRSQNGFIRSKWCLTNLATFCSEVLVQKLMLWVRECHWIPYILTLAKLQTKQIKKMPLVIGLSFIHIKWNSCNNHCEALVWTDNSWLFVCPVPWSLWGTLLDSLLSTGIWLALVAQIWHGLVPAASPLLSGPIPGAGAALMPRWCSRHLVRRRNEPIQTLI